MENAGVDFKMSSEASCPQTTLPVEFTYDAVTIVEKGKDNQPILDMTNHIRYSVYNSPESQSKKVTFEITDRMLQEMRPEDVAHGIHHQLVAGIYKALTDKICWLKPWGDHSIKTSYS
jgi:hypothetical protein